MTAWAKRQRENKAGPKNPKFPYPLPRLASAHSTPLPLLAPGTLSRTRDKVLAITCRIAYYSSVGRLASGSTYEDCIMTTATISAVAANLQAAGVIEIPSLTKAVVTYTNAVIGAEKALAGVYKAYADALHKGVDAADCKAALSAVWSDKGLSEKTLANKAAVFGGLASLQSVGVNVPALISHCSSENAVKLAVAKACKDAGIGGTGRTKAARAVSKADADKAAAEAAKAAERVTKAEKAAAEAAERAKKGDAVAKAEATIAAAKLADAKAAEAAKKEKATDYAARVTTEHAGKDASVAPTDAPAVLAVVEAMKGLRAEIGDDADLMAAFMPVVLALGKYDAVLKKAFNEIGAK